MLPWLQHRWTGLYLLIMALGAFMLFLYGFFPLKYHSGKLAHMDDLPDTIGAIHVDGQEIYNPGNENTVILMVIDGLRYDFVTEEYMPYTGQMIKNKSACIYVTIAEPPTVTMPRIKSPEKKKLNSQWRRTINYWRDIFAMMTGSVSTFADVALNFGAPEVRGDSVLRSVSARGKRSVLFGDDTWLRLFPGLWAESDGTTSFYVTDYTEVDKNVTRHLSTILKPDDKKKPTFDFLVLHYLGLDHIGHLEGARSPKIKPKLKEMDLVIQYIMTAMKQWDRTGVLFICGDHGMRDAGGHGGATPAEVLVPLVLASSDEFECPHEHGATVSQVDLAPTISWLLNSPVPAESTGRILPSLLPSDIISHLYLLHVVATHNSKQLELQKHKEFYKTYERAEQQFSHYLSTKQDSAAKIAKDFYEQALAAMAEYLTESTVQFDLFAIGIAIVLLYIIATALLVVVLFSLQPEIQRKISVSSHPRRRNMGLRVAFLIIMALCLAIQVLACFITETKSQFCSLEPSWTFTFQVVACIFSLLYFTIKIGIENTKDFTVFKSLNGIDYLLIGGTLFHAWSFFGTSFIEEEHLTWYFFWNTLMFFVLARTAVIVVAFAVKKYAGATEVQDKPRLLDNMVTSLSLVPRWVLLIALHRYLRTMNQTGDRWLHLPDTADWLNAPENATYLLYHVVIGTILTVHICIKNLQHMNNVMYIHTGFVVAMTICIFCYRFAIGDSVTVVDIFWKLLFAHISFEILTYTGLFKSCRMKRLDGSNKFEYKKPKEKNEEHLYDPLIEEPWNLDVVKLKLAKSLSFIMLNSMLLIVILLVRPHNVIMVPSVYITCVLTSKCLDHKLLDSKPGRNTDAVDVFSQTLVHLWIGSLFFFYQGNSNSLASVDLGAGYVGLSSYSAGRVALRMGLHAYAGPALAGAALFAGLARRATDYTQYLQSVWRATNIFAFHRVYVVAVYCIVATFFRDHLYVWTVFSPKLLYDFVATVFTLQALCTVAMIIITTHITDKLAKLVTYRTSL